MTKKTKKAPTAAANGNGAAKKCGLIRITVIANPETKRERFIRVNAAGEIVGTAMQKRLGVKQVKTWKEVEAKTWAEATKAVKAGAGTVKRAGK